MTNTETNNEMEISRTYLAKKLFASYAKAQLLEGKTESEIKESFTLDLLNEMTDKFCKENGFKTVD